MNSAKSVTSYQTSWKPWKIAEIYQKNSHLISLDPECVCVHAFVHSLHYIRQLQDTTWAVVFFLCFFVVLKSRSCISHLSCGTKVGAFAPIKTLKLCIHQRSSASGDAAKPHTSSSSSSSQIHPLPASLQRHGDTVIITKVTPGQDRPYHGFYSLGM